MRKIDIVGQKFGHWLALKEGPPKTYPTGRTHRTMVCQCDCGAEGIVELGDLRSGHSKSCGCYRREVASRLITKRCTKHGHARRRRPSATYRIWRDMANRCSNPNHSKYPNYGGRGITVCDRWQGKQGYENFLADMGERPKGLSLDRIDNNGNYEPGNCRWATLMEQGNNKRNNVIIQHNGREYTLAQLARKYGIKYGRFRYYYIRKGFTVKQTIEVCSSGN